MLSYATVGSNDLEPTKANGAMIAFGLPWPVDAFYVQGIGLGGTCKGAPGECGPGFYMKYFRDPEGNKHCARNLF
jgi:hypothetical protein